MSVNAKLAYLLSTCRKFSSVFFNNLLDEFSKNRKVAYRKYFSITIILGENNGNFVVGDSHTNFLDDTNVANDVLYLERNVLSRGEIMCMQKSLENKNIYSEKTMRTICSIASMIKRYKGKYEYIFIPLIINYGRNDNFVHQTAIVIDLSRGVLFYEPYGRYKKYKMSYKECVCDFLKPLAHLIDGVSMSYHDMYSLNIGIQGIIIDRNNERVDEFDKEYKELLTQLQTAYPREFDDVIENDRTDDKTIDVMQLMRKINRMHIGDISRKEYNELYKKTLTLYCGMNSKTCVSITMVEMNKFFSITNDIHEELSKFYELFNVSVPNVVLMSKLEPLLNVFKTKYPQEMLNKYNRAPKICRKLEQKILV